MVLIVSILFSTFSAQTFAVNKNTDKITICILGNSYVFSGDYVIHLEGVLKSKGISYEIIPFYIGGFNGLIPNQLKLLQEDPERLALLKSADIVIVEAMYDQYTKEFNTFVSLCDEDAKIYVINPLTSTDSCLSWDYMKYYWNDWMENDLICRLFKPVFRLLGFIDELYAKAENGFIKTILDGLRNLIETDIFGRYLYENKYNYYYSFYYYEKYYGVSDWNSLTDCLEKLYDETGESHSEELSMAAVNSISGYIPSGYINDDLLMNDGFDSYDLRGPDSARHPNTLSGYIAAISTYSIIFSESASNISYRLNDEDLRVLPKKGIKSKLSSDEIMNTVQNVTDKTIKWYVQKMQDLKNSLVWDETKGYYVKSETSVLPYIY